MQKNQIIRTVVRTAVSITVSSTVARVILNNAQFQSTLDEAVVRTGTIVTSYVVADAVTKQAEKLFDETVAEWKAVGS